MDRSLQLVEALAQIDRHNVSVAQLAIAWVLTRGDDIVPVIGARHPHCWGEAARALDITLSPEDLAIIEAAVPADAVAG